MNLEQRIALLTLLGKYIKKNPDEWQKAKNLAWQKNGWFTPEYVDLATHNIADVFLEEHHLNEWAKKYRLPAENTHPRHIGIVMAGNIPLVGFHDFLCAFVTGHRQTIKLSAKDDVLLRQLVAMLTDINPEVAALVGFEEMLKGCDAYIATGSNNSGRYFELYFAKYPHIIRRNRSSVAVLKGNESPEELERLVDDMQLYFGLGCRNVTKLYVPEGYDFIPLVQALGKNSHLLDNPKYKNNYDYQLALLLLNKEFYMSGGSLLLRNNDGIFAPLSVVNYAFYTNISDLQLELIANEDNIQCIIGQDYIPFGQAQIPSLTDYADGVDTMTFFRDL